jgi:D-serine deaminase-like pyridoxal phosphate-dependent protein
MVIIDAFVHCIDITSRRSAVHDPDRDHKLAQQHSQLKALEMAGPLSFRESVELSQAVKDMEKRDQKRKKFILLGEPKKNDSEAITRSPDVPGTGEEVVIS